MFIPVTGGQGISRPFVVGLILLLVFLGMQSDFVPPRSADSPAAEELIASGKDSTKERVQTISVHRLLGVLWAGDVCQQSSESLIYLQIILELSKSNEKLEVILLAPTIYDVYKVKAGCLF